MVGRSFLTFTNQVWLVWVFLFYVSLELCSMRSGVPRLLLGFYNSDKTTVGLLPWRRRFQPTAVTGTLPLHVRFMHGL